ncbi:bi-domain-containing oxidoreductase [uncultured Pseudoteredinibacter sp.]|uniref:bi-domain-containing oxidoreductase n=1 Tax=uncultured Pseudoteredinibacter sp. TaxID=1641701 RepID=UPI00262D003B|nr:bi-domain-containing oxidoreductase [uncultured Pseudoteredinibacter sp.]
MKQVTQTLRTGVVSVDEVPIPTLSDKFILVKNRVSVISAGTEKTKIDMGKKNLLQKAQARPDLVRQVINKVKTEGVKKTLQTINSRLDSPSPLGYSSAGEVVAVGGLVEGLQPGDRVACGGAGYANHADYVAIPKNLAVKVPKNVSDDEASFATVGSIALQGLRLADPKLGETFLVLGLGLLGQIAVQLLRSNGCTVIATDLDVELVKRAEGFGAIGAYPGSNIDEVCKGITAGHGVDGVLVCAGSTSNQPIELCGQVTREKGRVVVIGAIRMDIPREDYFKKEISVVISRSYGPGRYDPFYEENGNDYPLGYVRFTEQRNMQAFLELVSKGSVDVKPLITHRFDVDKAAEAYQLIEGRKTEPYLGIVMRYQPDENEFSNMNRIELGKKAVLSERIGISFFGAGNYATASLLPPMKADVDVELRGLATASGRTAQSVAKQFGFDFCVSDYVELLERDTNAVVVASRHDSHAVAVCEAFKKDKHVYVEKPLGLSIEELSEIHRLYESSSASLMVGFNRRFAPSTEHVLKHFEYIDSPLMINIRVNSGEIPRDHWIQDPRTGGGRIIGEGCHFVDLASAIAKSNPVLVSAMAVRKEEKSALLNDSVSVSLKFESGSVANIIYCADGSKSMAKERVEVLGGGLSAEIDDFKLVRLYSGDSKVKTIKQGVQDKGQANMLKAWLKALKAGEQCVPYDCLMSNSMATIMAVESISSGVSLNVDLATLEF